MDSYQEIRLLPVGRGFMPDEAKLECSLESPEVVRPSTSIPRAVVDSGSGESLGLSPETLGFTPNVVHNLQREHAPLAQWIEYLASNQRVARSNRAGGTIIAVEKY
jgi:hypothetical protein